MIVHHCASKTCARLKSLTDQDQIDADFMNFRPIILT